MSKTLYPFLFVTLLFFSCDEDDSTTAICSYAETPIDLSSTNTIIPLNQQNFWVYSDSLFVDGIFDSEKSTLLTIDGTYDVEGLKSFKFSSIFPQLTLKDDSLFSTLATPLASSPNCHELLFPMFFYTEDSIQVDGSPRSNKFVFRSSDSIETLVGNFSNNIIYKEENVFEVAVNEQIGIIKISFFVFDVNNEPIKRRILTLKDFDLN